MKLTMQSKFAASEMLDALKWDTGLTTPTAQVTALAEKGFQGSHNGCPEYQVLVVVAPLMCYEDWG